MLARSIIFIIIASFDFTIICAQNISETNRDKVYVGPCAWVLTPESCPDSDIKFYLYTRFNTEERQLIQAGETWENSNLTSSFYNPRFPVKIIIHGYNSDMMLTPLIYAKNEYLQRGDYNLFFVDWSVLAPAPCYPSAVHNTRHVGVCISKLVERIRESGNEDIHLIGFSLGAHVCNYVSTRLKMKNYTLPRITGLDPAMPLFVTADIDNKLDSSDAEFVDVLHTNSLVQGKVERCGHVDFYFSGGIIQPGCSGFGINPFQCSHHRAPDYFAESIQSTLGFWGWKCQSYFYYLLGMCTPTSEMQTLAGEDCRTTSRGMFFINTNAASPYATGRIVDSTSSSTKNHQVYFNPITHVDPFQREIDVFGKLEGNFNNFPFSPNDDDEWTNIFGNHHGTNQISQNYINLLKYHQPSYHYKSNCDANENEAKFSKVRWPNSRFRRLGN